MKLSQHILPTALMARRFHLSTELVIGLFALYGALVFNQSLLSLTLQLHPWHEPASWGLLAGILAIVTSLHFLLLALVSTQKNVKFWVLLFAIAGTLAAHYQAHYRVYFDPSMMRNILHTDYAEARELISWSLFSSVAVWFIPLALVLRQVQVKSVSRTRALQQRLLAVLLAGGVLIVVMLSLYAPLSSMMRNHKEARYLITPANTLWGLLQVVDNDTQAWAQGARLPIGLDAHAVPRPAARTRPLLVVWVVGETARAANWGLNGYSRATTPELAHWAAQPGFIHFPLAQSCGTNTEVSVPCLFSPWGRHDYDERRIRGSESLLHVLARAGVGVHWRDNQSGCKGVCDGLPHENTSQHVGQNPLCHEGQCWDEILLAGFEQKMAQLATGTPPRSHLWVLHQLGNHGPAYYKRYPPAYDQFQPACQQEDLSRCTLEQTVNAYDNAVIYTDTVLSRLLQTLQQQQEAIDSVVIYVSDHGESLGEKNLYLHGVPYWMAPEQQTRVPMFLWFSKHAAQTTGTDLSCLKARAQQPVQHDHLFHTVLSLFDVRTSLHQPEWDLLTQCQTRS
ncbi:MAG: phosphoethanolamine transferase [Burkholderiales bacterium]